MKDKLTQDHAAEHPPEGRIAALVQGELDPAEEAAFRNHLAVCPECALVERGLSRLVRSLRAFEPEPRTDFGASVMAAIDARTARSVRYTERVREWLVPTVVSAAAAGILLVGNLAGAPWSGTSGRSHGGTVTELLPLVGDIDDLFIVPGGAEDLP